jgi:hypothetical protein
MIRETVRTARKSRGCDTCWPIERLISPGEQYIEHVASPNHDDLDNTSWRRISVCADCAERYERSGIPAEAVTTA